MNLNNILKCSLVLVWDDEEAWEAAKKHPALENAGRYLLNVYARVFRCRIRGGYVIYCNEDNGECSLFIVGKISKNTLKWIIPVAGMLDYKKILYITDRKSLEGLGERVGFKKSNDGFMYSEVF